MRCSDFTQSVSCVLSLGRGKLSTTVKSFHRRTSEYCCKRLKSSHQGLQYTTRCLQAGGRRHILMWHVPSPYSPQWYGGHPWAFLLAEKLTDIIPLHKFPSSASPSFQKRNWTSWLKLIDMEFLEGQYWFMERRGCAQQGLQKRNESSETATACVIKLNDLMIKSCAKQGKMRESNR